MRSRQKQKRKKEKNDQQFVFVVCIKFILCLSTSRWCYSRRWCVFWVRTNAIKLSQPFLFIFTASAASSFTCISSQLIAQSLPWTKITNRWHSTFPTESFRFSSLYASIIYSKPTWKSFISLGLPFRRLLSYSLNAIDLLFHQICVAIELTPYANPCTARASRLFSMKRRECDVYRLALSQQSDADE